MKAMFANRIAKAAFVAPALLALSSCFVAPGEFESDLLLLGDGSYAFSYDGEVQLMTLAMMIRERAEAEAEQDVFEPYCEEEGTATDSHGDPIMVERACTEDEIIEQQADHEAEKAGAIMQAAEMRAALGGVDPSDEASIDDFAQRLERQAGWERVEHVGEGTFSVSYRAEGELPPQFGFPLISDVPSGQPFLTVARWDKGQVKVDAPLFRSEMEEGLGLFGMAAMTGAMGAEAGDDFELARARGRFTIRTDGEILTNNTETGPTTEDGLKVLRWDVGAPNRSAPAALIGF
jgi:hypothetical protein